MKGIALMLLVGSGVFAQVRGGGFSGAAPRMTGGFGSVLFPGGTPATSPGTQRFFGSTVFPGGGGPRLVVPNANNLTLGPRRGGLGLYGAQFGYGLPWFYYDPYGNYLPDQSADQQAAPAQVEQPQNVTVVYQGAPPAGPSPQGDAGGRWVYYPPVQPQPAPAAQETPAPEQPNYLLAFKDHNIYSALAYWVDGTTIHYITPGNHHNQASLDLVDRPLTERLSKESGYDVKLP